MRSDKGPWKDADIHRVRFHPFFLCFPFVPFIISADKLESRSSAARKMVLRQQGPSDLESISLVT